MDLKEALVLKKMELRKAQLEICRLNNRIDSCLKEIEGYKKGTASDDEGVVEFEATYSQKGIRDVHHEIAAFKKINGEWLYNTGMVRPTTVVRDTPKVGRNEPCPCGSGKKFKNCCGKN